MDIPTEARDLDLPRGRERRPVQERDRVYELTGAESRVLATVGAFRVLSESDPCHARADSQAIRRSLRHLEREGLIRTSPLRSDDRVVTLTDRGRDLLEANRYDRDDRIREPGQAFYRSAVAAAVDGEPRPRIVEELLR